MINDGIGDDHVLELWLENIDYELKWPRYDMFWILLSMNLGFGKINDCKEC